MSRKKQYVLAIFILIVLLIIFFDILLNYKIWRADERKNNISFVRSYRNLFDFDYILESSPCTSLHDKIMIITSYAGHIELRSAHRRTFSSSDLERFGIKRVFLLSKIDKGEISQGSIENEHFLFGDLIQGDFNEAYRNLTLKHIMGLKWAYSNCGDAKIIIKLDDDIVFNIHLILKIIDKITDRTKNLLMGYILRGTKPIRLKENKWYVTKSEYSKSYYPPFLSGWMYFTNPKTAKTLVDSVKDTPFFWIDDVYVTGILASINHINLEDIKLKNAFLEYFELMDCCISDMIEKNIMCEYAAGPNGNDNNLLVKFNEAINRCELINCRDRPLDKSLNNTCVSIKKSFPVNKGIPVVNLMKL